jgi:FtsP/CotA-like multicopper oxidase with cupredoxin domain
VLGGGGGAGLGAPIPAECNTNFGFSPATLGTYNAPVPAAVHLHGGEVPGVLDGGPDSWWTSNGIYGHGYYSKGGFPDAANGKAVYRFPNGQEAAPIWFHDHMLGATRLNVYAGIAGGYVVWAGRHATACTPSA